MAGRPRKPTALMAIAGNPGKRPLRSVPAPEPGMPEMPKGLRPAAKREWRQMGPKLLAMGLITPLDGKAFMMYCDAYADWQEAQQHLLKHTTMLATPLLDKDNNPVYFEDKLIWVHKENPAVNVKSKAMKTLLSLIAKFGLSPVDRERLHAEKPTQESKEDKELNWMPPGAASIQKPSYEQN